MILEVIQVGMFGTNCYIYGENGTVVIIDPGADAKGIKDHLTKNNYKPVGIIVTHRHPDHTSAVKKLKEEFNIPVYMSHLAKIRGFEIDKPVKENDEIEFGNKKLKVFETPGHTKEGIILVSVEDRLLFSGDTIFRGSIGRTDLGGSYDELMKSIKDKIMNNPVITDEFKIYPGHMGTTTVARERSSNPYRDDFL